MRGKSKLFRSLILAFIVSAGAVSTLAQTFRGDINGSVIDPTGAVVAGASVLLTDEQTSITRTMKSTSAGDFVFPDLPLGLYTITVTSDGFGTQKLEQVQVSQGSTYTAQIHLTLQNVGSVVSVEANALALDTTSNTQTTVITAQAVDSMPLDGRDFTQMIAVTPGFAGYAIGGGGTGMGSLNGTRYDQMNWQIDGIDNNDFYANVPAVNQGGILGIPGVIMPVDAID